MTDFFRYNPKPILSTVPVLERIPDKRIIITHVSLHGDTGDYIHFEGGYFLAPKDLKNMGLPINLRDFSPEDVGKFSEMFGLNPLVVTELVELATEKSIS